MRILVLNFQMPFVGGATFYRAWYMAKHLAQRGHAVTVMATSPTNVHRFTLQVREGVELWEAPSLLPRRWRHGYDFYEAFRRVLWLRGKTFDIVHALECRPVVLYPALAAQHHGARLVMEWLDWFGRGGSVEMRREPGRTLLRPIETYYEETFRRQADATIVLSRVLEARAITLGVRPETILRLPLAADVHSVYPITQAEARRALNLPAAIPIIGYMGSLFAEDAQLLLAAFALVRQVYPDTQLLFIGNPKVAIPATPGVVPLGFVSDTVRNQALAACNVLCLPFSNSLANRGRFPSKLADYLAAGRPTVVAADGEVGEIVHRAAAGAVAKPQPAEFAQQVLKLLADAARQHTLGQNARQAAETTFSWSHIVSQIESLYQRALA